MRPCIVEDHVRCFPATVQPANYSVSLKLRPEPVDLCAVHAAQAVELGRATKVVAIEARVPVS